MSARHASRRMSLDPRVLSQRSAPGGAADAGNVRVICRFRPVKPNEMVGGKEPEMPFEINKQTGSIKVKKDSYDMREFAFDEVFGIDTTQAEIFESVRYTLEGVLEGINGTILTYGQTSSGKTFTMEGPSMWDSQMQGVIPRAVERLFQLIAEADVHTAFTVKVSYFEIYCEKIRDLLNPANVNLKTREDKDEGIVVSGVTEVYVANKEDIMEVLETGKRFRASAPTLMNAESSRSHSLLSIHVTQRNEVTQRVRRGKLVLVDLAGSEKVSKTGAAGLRLEEAKNINRSLTTLGMVITALTEGPHNHVPYRDSRLTRVLQESLGGNSKTCLIICCAPEARHAPETVSTLRFGESAKKIKNHVHVNEELGVIELKAMLERANREIERLRRQLAGEATADEEASNVPIAPESATPSSQIDFMEPLPVEGLLGSVAVPREDDEDQDTEATMLRLRIAELEAELDVEREKGRWERDTRIQTAAQEAALQKVVQRLEGQVIDLRKSLEQANAAVTAAEESAAAAQEAAAAATAAATAGGSSTRPVSWRVRSRSRSYHDTSMTANALISELDQLTEQGDSPSADSAGRARSRSQVPSLAPLPEDAAEAPQEPPATTAQTEQVEAPKQVELPEQVEEPKQEEPQAPPASTTSEVQVEDVVLSDDKYQEMKLRMQELEKLFEQELGFLEEQLEQREQDLEQAKQDILDLEKEMSESRQEHETSVQMLMAKLVREQEHRARLATRLDMYEHQAGRSEKERDHERTFFERWLGSGKHSEKEFQRLEKDMQVRLNTITSLQEEMAAQREAHSVVLQTKEHILHSLLEQNTTLVKENENLTRQQADQERRIEELLAALRSVDGGSARGGSRPNSIRRPRLDSGDGLASPDSRASDDTGNSSGVIHTIHGHSGGVITSIRGGGAMVGSSSVGATGSKSPRF